MAAGPREAGASEGTAQRRTGLAQDRGVQRARPGVLCPVAAPGQRQLPPLTANGTGASLRGERNRRPCRTEPALSPEPVPVANALFSQVLTRSRASIRSATFVTTQAITI